MTDTFLPFAKPSIDQATIDEVADCLKSGWITTGPRVAKFEEALKDYCQAPHAFCVSSATAGLHLALLALDLKPGDEVITTPLTFIATLNTIVHAGAKPVLVDIDPTTLNIDANQIEAAITKKTKAIMPVHFAGRPVDLTTIYKIAEKHGLRVIEDAAHSIGTHYQNKIIGSFGDIQVFSFHPNKNMTTGEGGCITVHNDDELAKKIKVLRFHGIDRDAFNRFSKSGSQQYDIIAPGYKYNMMDIQAAIGLHQLPKLDSFIEKRTALVTRYQEYLASWEQITLPKKTDKNDKHAWHLFTILINEEQAGMNRETFIEKMKENHIGTGLHYQATHLYTYYRETFGYKAGDFPNTENIAERIVSLPLFPDMTTNEQDRAIETMAKIFSRSI